MECFLVPEHYTFERELPPSLMTRIGLFIDGISKRYYVCKSFIKDQIGSPERVENFKLKLEQVKLLNNPLIVSYTEVRENEKYLTVIRPYIQEGPISESIGTNPLLMYNTWKTITSVVLQLHSHHIFPTFIHPNNIFLVQGDTLAITDVYPMAGDLNVMLHSPSVFYIGFLAPECSEGKTPPGIASDLWSLGVLLTFMVTGSLPWSSKNVFTLIQQITTGHLEFTKPLTREIEMVIRGLLNLDPSKRKLLCEMRSGNDIPKQKSVPRSVFGGGGAYMRLVPSGRLSAGLMNADDPLRSVRATTTSLLNKKGLINNDRLSPLVGSRGGTGALQNMIRTRGTPGVASRENSLLRTASDL